MFLFCYWSATIYVNHHLDTKDTKPTKDVNNNHVDKEEQYKDTNIRTLCNTDPNYNSIINGNLQEGIASQI